MMTPESLGNVRASSVSSHCRSRVAPKPVWNDLAYHIDDAALITGHCLAAENMPGSCYSWSSWWLSWSGWVPSRVYTSTNVQHHIGPPSNVNILG